MAKALEVLKPNIVELCRQKKISQAGLARKLGMLPQQLSHQLSGKRDFRISLIDRLCEALEVSPEVLFKQPGLSILPNPSKEMEDRFRRLEMTISTLEKGKATRVPADIQEWLDENLEKHPDVAQVIRGLIKAYGVGSKSRRDAG